MGLEENNKSAWQKYKENHKRILEQMKLVQDKHTYINRLTDILKVI